MSAIDNHNASNSNELKQMRPEPTYLEKVESYLVDDFHHGLHQILVETIWSDVRVGDWSDHTDFFACLEREYEYLLAIRSKPLQLEMHLRDLNFSGQQIVNGASEKFLASILPCSRQKILLFHCLGLMLELRNRSVDLSLLLRALRREAHQSLRLVFFYLRGDKDPHGLQEFIDDLDRFESLSPKDTQLLLAAFMIRWLERQGVKGEDVDSLKKLHTFFLSLTRWLYYRPDQTPGPPPEFDYGNVFQDWQKVGFFNSLHYECDRLITLTYLEGLSHAPGHTKDVLTVEFEDSSHSSTESTTHFPAPVIQHFYGPVGAVQTAAESTANVTQEIIADTAGSDGDQQESETINFVDWCTRILNILISEGDKDPYTRTEGVDEYELFRLLFDVENINDFHNSPQRMGTLEALTELAKLGLLEQDSHFLEGDNRRTRSCGTD